MKIDIGDAVLHLPSGRSGRVAAKITKRDGKHLEMETKYCGESISSILSGAVDTVRDHKKAFKRLGPPRRP